MGTNNRESAQLVAATAAGVTSGARAGPGKRGGPRTEAGKHRSRLNAVRHGLLAEKTITSVEEGTQPFLELHYRMLQDFEPVGALERLLVDRLVTTAWRLMRAGAIERDILLLCRGNARGDGAMGYAFLQDAENRDGLGKVARYEAHLDRTFYRALHELQRIQHARRSGTSPAPLAVDVAVDLNPAR